MKTGFSWCWCLQTPQSCHAHSHLHPVSFRPAVPHPLISLGPFNVPGLASRVSYSIQSSLCFHLVFLVPLDLFIFFCEFCYQTASCLVKSTGFIFDLLVSGLHSGSKPPETVTPCFPSIWEGSKSPTEMELNPKCRQVQTRGWQDEVAPKKHNPGPGAEHVRISQSYVKPKSFDRWGSVISE